MSDATAPAIALSGIAKAFGPVQAIRNASLTVARGEIHALMGENGAGKSTLMRVLAGMFRPDGGTAHVEGADVTGWDTADAIAAGVGMVHQHFMLVPTLTVAENVMLGREMTRGVALDRAGAEAAVRALCEKTGLVVDPARKVADLSVGEAQRVEILKVLFRGARILILDEPTAVLSPPEVQELWRVLRTLRANGGTVVLITHKLDEVIDISDTITVMRAGETVGRMATAGTTPADIARAMVGRDVALAQRVDTGVTVAPRATPRLEVRDLCVAGAERAQAVDHLTFSVQAGEIFGIAGVEGNGQTELIEALAGLRRADAGSILLDGQPITACTVSERIDRGLAHVPEDRHLRGLVLDYAIADNLILGRQHQYAGTWNLDFARVGANAAKQVAAYDIRPADAQLPARALSGGNQQKIVIARELGGAQFPAVILAAQPTRGVDVGAIEFIHARLRAARDAGSAVVLVSADLTEVIALSTRVAVMYGGKIVTIVPGDAATPLELGPWMTGAMRAGAA
ncbi:MAG: ABC transporter ATP-binding protein [Gemmatimonadetes bacterium]|nr:ABC transporter ATP-binding protein [Gemmatimonadota bacterium]